MTIHVRQKYKQGVFVRDSFPSMFSFMFNKGKCILEWVPLPLAALALIIWLNRTIKPLFLILYRAGKKRQTELTSQVILTRPFISWCLLRNVFPLSPTLPKELYFHRRRQKVIDMVNKQTHLVTAWCSVKHLQFKSGLYCKKLRHPTFLSVL